MFVQIKNLVRSRVTEGIELTDKGTISVLGVINRASTYFNQSFPSLYSLSENLPFTLLQRMSLSKVPIDNKVFFEFSGTSTLPFQSNEVDCKTSSILSPLTFKLKFVFSDLSLEVNTGFVQIIIFSFKSFNQFAVPIDFQFARVKRCIFSCCIVESQGQITTKMPSIG